MLTDFISIISFTFESNYLISSLESSNGEPSLVSTTSIPTPPPSPLITRQRHANLCNNKGTVDNIISQLGFAFALKDLGPLNYFLGTEIVPHVSGILLSQKKYILELLQSDDLSNCKPVSSPMVCQYIHASIENHWSAVKRILRYLYGNPDTSLEALSDADWAGDSDDRRSTRGFSIYLALADTVVELTWLQALLYELGIRSSSTPILWCDNLGATYLSANPIFRVRTKHIEIDYTLFGKRMVTCGYPWPEIEGKGFAKRTFVVLIEDGGEVVVRVAAVKMVFGVVDEGDEVVVCVGVVAGAWPESRRKLAPKKGLDFVQVLHILSSKYIVFDLEVLAPPSFCLVGGSARRALCAFCIEARLKCETDSFEIKYTGDLRFFREPSQPTVEPTVDTPSQEGTESITPCLNSMGQKGQQVKPEASCPPVAYLTVPDLRQSGHMNAKVEEEKAMNECKKASEDEDMSTRALLDRPVCSDDTKSGEVLATVKLEPNNVTLPHMSAKETDSHSLKSHSKNVTSSTLDCSSLGKATPNNARTPLGSENGNMNQVTSKKAIGDGDTSNTSLVDRPAFNSDLGGSADTPNQGEGSKKDSDDMKSLKALATVKSEPDSVMLADMSTKQTDFSNDVASFRMNFSSSSKTTVDNPSSRAPLELKCSTMNQVMSSEISPVVLKSLTPKIEKSELDECRPSGNGISKMLSPAVYSAPHVSVNKVFDNVAVPSTLTLEYRASDVSSKHINANGKGTDNLSRPMASGTNFSLEHCISMSPTKETVVPSSIVGSRNNVSNVVTTVQTTDIGNKLILSLTPAASLENRVHQSGSTFGEDDKAEIKRAIISNRMTMDKLTGKGTETSENVMSSKTVDFGNNANASRAISTLQTIENGKLNLSLVTAGPSENKVNQSGNTFDEDDKAQVKRAISMLKMTESSQNGVGSGNNVNNVTVPTTENDKLSLSLTTTASLENTFPHSESTCNEDDKSQVKRAITSNDVTIKRNSAAPLPLMHDVKCSEKSPVTAFPDSLVNCNKEVCEEPLDNGFANNLVHYNKEVCEDPVDSGFGYENFPSDMLAASEVDNIDELSYGYDSHFEDGEPKESSIQTWEGYEEDREIGHCTDNRGAPGAPESPSRIRSTDEISSVLVPEKRVSSDQVSGSEPNETGITDVSMKDASQSDQWKMNVSGSDILPENRSSSSEITKMRVFSSIQFSPRLDRFGPQTDNLETKAQGSRFYRREPLLRTGEPSTRDAFLNRGRFRMQGCSSNNADDSASRPLRESSGLRSIRRARGGLTWNRHSPPFPGPSFRRSVENLTKEDQNDNARPGPSYVARQSIRSRLVVTSEEDEFRARLGLRPSGDTCHNRVVNVGRGRTLRYGSRPNGAGPRGRYFGPPNDEFDEPSLEYSSSFTNRRRCENLPCAHHHSGSTSPPRSARSPISDGFRRRSRSPNLRSDTRIRRPLSPSYRRGFEPDHIGGYNAESRNNNSPPNSRWVKFKQRTSLSDRRSSPPGRIENFRSGHPGRFSDLRGGGRGGSRYLGSDGDVTDHGHRRGGFVRRYDTGRPVKHAPYDEEDDSGPVFDSRDKEPSEFHGRGNAKPYVNGTDSRFRDLPRRNREERENW
ncbi:hypothetical protein Tco_1505628 [Tanacetum coccineum]